MHLQSAAGLGVAPGTRPVCAVVDAGSNTLRFLVARPAPGGRGFEYLLDGREVTRLGRNLKANGNLDPASFRASLAVMETFVSRILDAGATWVAAAGTAALRRARDGRAFLSAVEARTGLAIQVIDQELEALLTLKGARAVVEVHGRLAVADIGGRSTELVLEQPPGPPAVFGADLGVVSLKEHFVVSDPPRPEELRLPREHLAAALEAASFPDALPDGMVLVGTGGTFTTLAALALGLPAYRRELVNGFRLTAAGISEIAGRLESMKEAERAALPGMEAARADIIVPGVELVSALLSRLGRTEVLISDAGIMEGCLLAGLEGDPAVRLTSCRRLRDARGT